ncbi:MAG: rod shape-determining protein RodA [Dongiaceae bacterium]
MSSFELEDVFDYFSRQFKRWRRLPLLPFWVVVILGALGVLMLYSAGGGNLSPWAMRHAVRFLLCLALMIAIALVDIRIWLKYSYIFYVILIGLLLAVEIKGVAGMGAQRWIDLGVVQLQPSELMKIGLILVLARYYHGLPLEDVKSFRALIPPLLLILLPVILVLRQPNLGTAMMLILAGGAIMFLAGVRWWLFVGAALGALGAAPVIWHFLHAYQKQRVLTFLDPERDPLGAGYHIMQSKIALGSGGFFGKGFLEGTQSHLNFLPEKQTDFIFTVLAEEMGMLGALIILILYGILFVYGFFLAQRATSQFGRLLAMGLTLNLFLYLFINIGMVMGLLPVVGVPLPLLSYGGTSMLAVMIGFGLLFGLDVHDDQRIPLRGVG